MKSVKVYLMVVGLTALVAAMGCKSPVGTRKMYGRGAPIRQEPPPGGPIDSDRLANNTMANNNNLIEADVKPITDWDFSKWTRNESAFEAQTIYYGYDSAAIKDSEKTKALIVAAYLKSNPRNAVLIEGNCDERGTEEYNRALGSRRALAAREALIAAGIDAQHIDLISYGEDKPAEPGHDEAAWKKNRRAAFVLLTPPQ